jgi:ABC-type oligopeptide transport system substrate-binding subunit
VLLLLKLFLFIALAQAENPAKFRVRLHEDLGSLDWNYGEVNGEIVYQLMEGLFRADHKSRPQKAAVQSFRWSENKTKLVLQLRHDRVWSDGAPVCAQHFVDSWARLRSKKFASPYAHYASVLESFAAHGCHELEVHFTRPAPEATALFANSVFFPLRLDSLEKFPRMFTEGTSLLVNGPFRVAEWKANSYLMLERNPKFAGRKPVLEQVEFRFIPEDTTAKAMFDLGELDWMKDVPLLLRSAALERSQEFRLFPSLIAYYFGLNASKSKLLRDPAVRHLLSDSLDRSEIPRVLGKECRGTNTWLLPELLGNRPRKNRDLDLVAMKKLAATAKAGEMDLVLRVYGKAAHKALAEWAQGQWEKKLGVRIPIEVQESKIYWKEIAVNPSPIFFGGVTAPYGHPRAFLQEFLSSSTANWTGWASPDFDRAVAEEKFADAEQVLERDGFVIPLYQRDTAALVKQRWKGFFINPLGQAFLSEVR